MCDTDHSQLGIVSKVNYILGGGGVGLHVMLTSKSFHWEAIACDVTVMYALDNYIIAHIASGRAMLCVCCLYVRHARL